jgi:hypothetical protein
MHITPEYGLLHIDYIGMKHLQVGISHATRETFRLLGSCEHEGTRSTDIKLEESRADTLDSCTLLYLCANCSPSQESKRGD